MIVPMITPRDRDLIAVILGRFADQIEHVSVFGSRATGRARPNSDIDLVLYGSLDTMAERRIATELEESRLPVTVDIAVYSRIKDPLLKAHIDSVALELFSQDDLRRARETQRT